MNKKISIESIIDALDSVTWYNGIAEMVYDWLNLPVENFFDDYRQIHVPESCFEDEQLEFIWMLSVLLFGDYGTSPRSGWIEDVDGFMNFIQQITRSWRENEEREQHKN